VRKSQVRGQQRVNRGGKQKRNEQLKQQLCISAWYLSHRACNPFEKISEELLQSGTSHPKCRHYQEHEHRTMHTQDGK
jgi:hypothetical protein